MRGVRLKRGRNSIQAVSASPARRLTQPIREAERVNTGGCNADKRLRPAQGLESGADTGELSRSNPYISAANVFSRTREAGGGLGYPRKGL
jgi:hypothetical protein